MSLTWIILRAVLLTPWLGWLSVSDIRSRRLPNVLTLGGLAAALLMQAGWNGWPGFVDGLSAAGLAVLFLIIPFLLRAAGAGDVKMLAACAAALGTRSVPLFLFAVSMCGLAVAVAMLLMRRVTAARLKHALRSVFDFSYDRRAGAAAIPKKDDERARVPFGVAISLGTLITLAVEALKA